jgi:hypothetical protein
LATLRTLTQLIFLSLVILFSKNQACSQDKEPGKTFSSKGRFSISAGMGLSLINTQSFNEYLRNEIPYKSKDSVKAFSLGVEFFSGLEMGMSRNLSLRADYLYSFRSDTYYYTYLVYDYFYSIHQPSINAFYLINGMHYQLKLGGGVGLQYLQIEVNDPSANGTFKSLGAGLRGEIIYSAQLSKRLSSYISGFAQGNLTGKVKDSNGNTLKSAIGKDVDLSGFGVGARLGITVFLN